MLNILLRRRTVFLFLPLIALLVSGCQTVTYKEGYLPRTPVVVKKSIKKGPIKLVINEPLLSELRSQGPATIVGGITRFNFSPGQYAQKVAEAVFADAVAESSTAQEPRYIYTIKDFQFAYKIWGGSMKNAFFFTKGTLSVEVATPDGKPLFSKVFDTEYRKSFETALANEKGFDTCMNTAIIEVLHETLCKSMTELSKYE
jgi:hypothetical protein